MLITTNKQNSAGRAQGLRYFVYFRPLAAIRKKLHNSYFVHIFVLN